MVYLCSQAVSNRVFNYIGTLSKHSAKKAFLAFLLKRKMGFSKNNFPLTIIHIGTWQAQRALPYGVLTIWLGSLNPALRFLGVSIETQIWLSLKISAQNQSFIVVNCIQYQAYQMWYQPLCSLHWYRFYKHNWVLNYHFCFY